MTALEAAKIARYYYETIDEISPFYQEEREDAWNNYINKVQKLTEIYLKND